MKYSITIGKMYDIESGFDVPKRTIIISEEQREVILLFANKKIDKDGYPVYEINGCEFNMWADFSDKPYYKQPNEKAKSQQ